MLAALIAILLVTLFVLGLFGLVQWVLSFFPRLNSVRVQPSIGKWWIILLGVVMWLHNLSGLLNENSTSEWTRDDYLKVFYLFASTYLIVFVWRSTRNPANQSTLPTHSNEDAEGQF